MGGKNLNQKVDKNGYRFIFTRMKSDFAKNVRGRIDKSQAINLLESGDILSLGEVANDIRVSKHGSKAYYTVNAAVTYSNICEVMCPICSFSRRVGQEGAYRLSFEDVFRRSLKFKEMGADEIHIIGGINSKLGLNYYTEVLRAVKKAGDKLNIVAYTVSECSLMSKVSGKTLEEVYELLKDAGLGAIPGGGAEIFSDSIREKIAPDKLRASEWLDAMRRAHRCGIRTNATMLYGHIEKAEHVVDHLFRLRELQDETGGFKAFVPLPFRRGTSKIESKSSGVYDLKICALSRLVLDNFEHIRVLSTHFGERMTQILLNFGADDIGGTHWGEEVATAAGMEKKTRSESYMRTLIVGAGFNPFRTNSNYAF